MPASSTRRSVLVPLDGSALAEHALRAAGLVLGSGDELHLLHITPAAELARLAPSSATSMKPSIQAYLRSIPISDGVIVKTLVVRGREPARSMLDYAGQNGISLIAMTTHGAGGPSLHWIGQHAAAVAHRAAVPVLLVPPLSPDGRWTPLPGFRRVVLFLHAPAPPSDSIAGLGRFLAGATAMISLPEIVAPLYIGTSDRAGPVTSALADPSAARIGRVALDRAAAVLREQGLEATRTITRYCNTALGVLDHAAACNADLIVISGPAPSGDRPDPAADKIMRGSRRPVLLWRWPR